MLIGARCPMGFFRTPLEGPARHTGAPFFCMLVRACERVWFDKSSQSAGRGRQHSPKYAVLTFHAGRHEQLRHHDCGVDLGDAGDWCSLAVDALLKVCQPIAQRVTAPPPRWRWQKRLCRPVAPLARVRVTPALRRLPSLSEQTQSRAQAFENPPTSTRPKGNAGWEATFLSNVI